jgi:PAS domain S-box-containing protein
VRHTLRRLLASARPQGGRPLGVYFGLLFVLVALGGAVAILLVDRDAERDARRDAAEDAGYSAQTAAMQLAAHVALLKATATQLAANPGLTNAFESPESCTLTFQGIAGPDRSHLDVLRPDGAVACSSRPRGAASATYAGSDWLPRALREPHFVAPLDDSVANGRVAVATAPIPGGAGVVAAFADLEVLGAYLAEQYGGGRENVFLVTDADGVVIARSLDPKRWLGRRVPPGWLEHEPGEWVGLDGTERIYAGAPVAEAGWTVHVGERKSTAFALVGRLRERQLETIGAGLLLFLLGAGFVYRTVAAPIRRLGSAVHASSLLESTVAVEVSGPAEVQALAREVNALTAAARTELAERRRAEAAAQASEVSYRLLFESNPSPMWVFDEATLRFLAVNDAAVDAYGWSRDEFLELTIEQIRAPEEAERLHSHLGGEPGQRGLRHAGVWRHQRKDGSELDVEIHSHDHVFEGRKARVVTALDVTERLAAEEALRRSEARYRELFENASDLISSVDLDGRLTDVNEAFVRTLGYSREELIGKQLMELVPPESHEVLLKARERKLEGAETTIYEHELLTRDGERIQVEVASRLIERDGMPVGTEAICRNISERRRLEEELRQAQRLEAIGRLAGGVAHDFNNLLTVISGYTETLLVGRDRADEPELEQIAIAAERAAALTRQLLAFSRRQVLQPRVIDPNEVVRGVTPMLNRLIGEDIELRTSLADPLDPVLADPSQLEQVLVNLTVNARDAMPHGGRLEIRTANVELDEEYVGHHGESRAGPHVMLSVRDTGTGMDADTLAHVFEPFYTTKEIGTGTGLGLATVYGIVKQSGGSVWVYSEPGQGATVNVYLPRSESRILEEVVRPAAPKETRGSETILLAEDEESLRRLTARMLETRGYEVIAAETANEAVRIAAEQGREIDLLLTDLIMPELSGGELAKKVRAALPSVRVLFMSGYADDVMTSKGALEPGAPFLEKPFSANDLAAKVRETLDAAA